MQAALLPLRLRSTRSGTAVMYLGDSHVSVTRGPDSDTPVRHQQVIFSAAYLPCNSHLTICGCATTKERDRGGVCRSLKKEERIRRSGKGLCCQKVVRDPNYHCCTFIWIAVYFIVL